MFRQSLLDPQSCELASIRTKLNTIVTIRVSADDKPLEHPASNEEQDWVMHNSPLQSGWTTTNQSRIPSFISDRFVFIRASECLPEGRLPVATVLKPSLKKSIVHSPYPSELRYTNRDRPGPFEQRT